jgi:Cu/Ag efflux pump CusA
MWFTRVSIGNPVMAVMVMLAFVVLGLFAVQRLKVDQFPSIEFPFVVVTTEYPGASPEVVEIEVTRKIGAKRPRMYARSWRRSDRSFEPRSRSHVSNGSTPPADPSGHWR